MSLQRVQLRWRLSSRWVRVVALSVAVSAVALVAFLALNASRRIDPTAASVLVAVIFGTATVFQQRQTQRRQHTVKMLTSFQSSERLAAADAWMADRIRLARRVDADIDAADEVHVITLLDYYEFLAVLAQRGMVDIPLLLDLRGGAMTRCFRLCRRYILDRRATVWPGLYSCLEAFAELYAGRVGDPVPDPPASLDAADAERSAPPRPAAEAAAEGAPHG
jgi:hypothetical protein